MKWNFAGEGFSGGKKRDYEIIQTLLDGETVCRVRGFLIDFTWKQKQFSFHLPDIPSYVHHSSQLTLKKPAIGRQMVSYEINK